MNTASSKHDEPDADITSEMITHDVRLFFSRLPWSSGDLSAEYEVANRLLDHAWQCGSIAEVRSLCLWKIANYKFTSVDVQEALSKAPVLARREDHDDLLDFYADLLDNKSLGPIPALAGLTLAAEALSWHVDLEVKTSDFTQAILKHILSSDVSEALDRVCSKLLVDGDPDRALSLVDAFSGVTSSGSSPVREKIFSLAIETGHLSCCSRILRWKSEYNPDEMLPQQLEQFIIECDQRRTHDILAHTVSEIARHASNKVLIDQLSHEALVSVATACTAEENIEPGLFQLVREKIPDHLRGPVDLARTCSRLKERWKATRHFGTTWKEYRLAIDHALQKSAVSSEVLVRIKICMVEICNSANRPDQGFQILSEISQDQIQTDQSICAAAMCLAKKSAWDQLARLLELLAKTSRFVSNRRTSRCLNNVIHLYSRQHTAIETWKFVTGAIERLGFSPNQATTDIMLQCFVAQKALSLIPDWFRYLRIIGHKMQIYAETGAKLLTTYYHDQRPPHALMMWFTRSLVQTLPSFEPMHFDRLLKEAVGYDIRHSKGLLYGRARTDLARLESAPDTLPVPVRSTSTTRSPSKGLCSAEGNKTEPLDDPSRYACREEEAVASVEVQMSRNEESDQTNFVSTRYLPMQQRSKNSRSPEEQHAALLRAFNSDEDIPEDNNLDLVERPMKGHGSAAAAFEHAPDNDDTRVDGHAQRIDQSPDSDVPVPAGMADFSDLRPDYNRSRPNEHGTDATIVASLDTSRSSGPESQGREVVRDMILAISVERYQTVLDLYHSSLDETGLPVSPMALEITTEACIRLNKGDRREAENILNNARIRGMDVSCAMGPILLHQMYHLNPADKKDVNNLRATVIEYYQMNQKHGWPVKHYVGVTAANILINNRRAGHGLTILNSIFHSGWAIEKALDIVAMTVYLRAYAALRLEKGIRWVVHTVLTTDMRIDQKFIDTFEEAFKRSETADEESEAVKRRMQYMNHQLRGWRRACIEQRSQQRLEAKLFGKKLVECIIKCVEASAQPRIDVSSRQELEHSFFGAPVVESEDSTGNYVAISETRRTRLAYRRAMAIAQAIMLRPEVDVRRKRTVQVMRDEKWTKQYRAFLRLELVMPDGKAAAFRYRLTDKPG